MDNKQWIVIALMFGLVVGYVMGLATVGTSTPTQEEALEDMDTMTMSSDTIHAHAMTEVDSTLPVPTVSIETSKDSKDGYNIHLVTEHFRFTPELVNNDPVQGEGHAHIYVNGEKIARLYGDWFNLSSDDMQSGENVIEVTLNANDHSEWVIDGQHIADSTSLTK